ncbi:MAG: hypothetical protein EBQ89_05610, partial [Alphaproteobacteria bacterium]|nr:hypothetical protein [Alphaproteobacteria bacterium]
MDRFYSNFQHIGSIQLPKFSGTRVMMMPLVIGDEKTIPAFLNHWKDSIGYLSQMSGYEGEVGYITIDEKEVAPSTTHRRSGKHVDGIYY